MTAYSGGRRPDRDLEVLDESVTISGVSITKTGPKEVMPGQPIRYTLKNIAQYLHSAAEFLLLA